MKKITIYGLCVVLAIGAVFYIDSIRDKGEVGAVVKNQGVRFDIVGTQTGTSTVGVGFYGNHTASTTYPMRIGNISDTLFLTLQANAASTSAAAVSMVILGSNDSYCDTSTTTTVFDVVTTGQVNWYDIGSNIKDLAGSTSLSGTTTINWTGLAAGDRKSLTLTDLDVACIALEVNASSTVLSIQGITK